MRRRKRLLQFGKVALAGLCVWMAGHAAAVDITSEVGTFGEIRNWLIIKTPEWRLEVDPFAALGGEANYAAMGHPGLVPSAGAALVVPGTNAGAKVRIGDGTWEAVRMVLPDMPGIWNEYPRLVVPDGYGYAYCRLDSPQDMQANVLTGLSHSKCRLYLNGRDLGTLEGGSG